MARKISKDGDNTSGATPHLDELIALANSVCQNELRVLKLRVERAYAIRDAMALCAAFEQKLEAFRRLMETARDGEPARVETKPSATVTSRRTETIRRLARMYQKLKAQLGPAEQKAIRAVYKSSGITAAIREAREMIRNGKRMASESTSRPRRGPSPRFPVDNDGKRVVSKTLQVSTSPAPVERRPSAEERLVRAKLAVLRAYSKSDELKHAAAMHDLDDLLPREFEISKTRIEELYQETQGARRPFFVRDLILFIPDAERAELLAELGGLYDMSLALLVEEAEATAPGAPLV